MPAVSKKACDLLCGSTEPGDVNQWQVIFGRLCFEQHCCPRSIEYNQAIRECLSRSNLSNLPQHRHCEGIVQPCRPRGQQRTSSIFCEKASRFCFLGVIRVETSA